MHEAIKILLSNFKALSHDDRVRYVYHAYLLWIFRDQIDWNQEETLNTDDHQIITKTFKKVQK